MRRFFVATLGLVALLGTSTAMALGLGEIQVRSALNQPFLAEIPLLAVPADDVDAVRVKLAERVDFERMGIERADYLSNLDFKVVPGSPPRIEINASRTVREPFLTFLLDVRSATGRVLREYTVLLDPPPPIIAGQSATSAAPIARAVVPTRLPQQPQAPVPTPASRPSAPAPVVAAATPATAAPSVTPTTAPRQPSATPANPVTPAVPPVTRSSPPAEGADRYTVNPGETLWGVATVIRPDDGVEMNQVIYALVNANPTAFDRGRFEGLMKNVTLDVPSRADMLETSVAAAQAGVAGWRRSGNINARSTAAAPRRPPAVSTTTPAPTVTATPTATAGPTTTPTAVVPALEDAGGPEAEVPAVDDSLSGEPVDAQEQSPTDAAAELGADDDGLSLDATGDEVVEDDSAASGDGATDTEAASDAEAPLGVEAERNIAELDAGDEMVVEEPETVVAPTVSDSPRWPIWLLVLMVALIALLLIRRRRQGDDDKADAPTPPPAPKTPPTVAMVAGGTSAAAASSQPGSLEAAQRQADEAEALFMAAYAQEQADEAERTRAQAEPGNVDAIPDFDAAQVIDEPMAETSSPNPMGTEADARSESGWAEADALLSALDEPDVAIHPVDDDAPAVTDPLTEADTHIAFGLYDDALDTLDSALEKEPYRAEYLIKRAEVLLDAGRIRAFIAAASDAKPHLSDAQWKPLAETGRRVAPDEPLFAIAVPEADAGLDFNFDAPLYSPADQPNETPAAEAPSQSASADENVVDFSPHLDEPAAPAVVPPPEAKAHHEGLHFDLSGFDESPAITPSAATPTEREAGLEFDLSDFDETPASPPPPVAPAAERDEGLTFDLSGFDEQPPPSPPAAGSAAGALPALDDLDALDDFKLDDFTLDEELMDDADADADSESLGTGDEAGTKLDLARAYVDMGDAEMARALLGEVLIEGNGIQQDEARALMARLG
jgi:pilus assembly protein FimV